MPRKGAQSKDTGRGQVIVFLQVSMWWHIEWWCAAVVCVVELGIGMLLGMLDCEVSRFRLADNSLTPPLCSFPWHTAAQVFFTKKNYFSLLFYFSS